MALPSPFLSSHAGRPDFSCAWPPAYSASCALNFLSNWLKGSFTARAPGAYLEGPI